MWLTRWLVMSLIALVGCGNQRVASDQPLTPSQLDAVLAAATLDQEVLPDSFEWEVSADNPAYLDACAEAAAGLTSSAPAAMSTERSESYVGDRLGDAGDFSDPSSVRVLDVVTVFESEAAAAARLGAFDEGALIDCMEDGIATEVAAMEDEPAKAGLSDGVDFEVSSESPGDESTLHSAHFSATVAGGYDDYEEIDLSVTRVGPTVATIAVWASAQNLSRTATGDVTLGIAGAVADRTEDALG